MPEMQGPELAERATAIRPDLTVVFMSGYAHEVIIGQDPLAAMPREFVEKPFTADQLLAGVRTALDSARNA
jgi:FixJ family two-component response regulator